MFSSKSFIAGLLLFIIIPTSQADVILHDHQGHRTPFSSLKGKWILINYWASWCQPCLDEIPELNAFYNKHKGDNVVMYGVNYDALPPAQQLVLIKKYGLAYPNLTHDPARQLNLGDIRGVPVTFVFNPKGKLVKKLYGQQTQAGLKQIIS